MAAPRRKAALSRTQRLANYLDKVLLPDLRGRAKEPALADSLAARHAFEREQKRTAASLHEWTDQTLTQVAVAWVLSAVFVRVLEDRALLPRKRLAGGDAQDSERAFYEMFSNLGARDYLAAVFHEVAHAPVLTELLGPALNPAWKLAPSHDAVRALFELLRDADADGNLSMRFDDADTRFLGDLYQDLSAEVRERFALLQTPDFVEAFILDRTLEPAVRDFGLDALRLIDPTCGSGHFLLGAFRRLVEHLRRARPAAELRDVAAGALDRVYGSDINPYAVAIARFRLLLAYVDMCGVTSIAEAPALPALARNVVVADSLLLGAEGTRDLMELALDADSQAKWGPRAFDFVDPPAVHHVFRQRYHAVVGNPPYILCRDAALRESYRQGYPDSASGKFALAAPFTQRFFKLAVDDGRVGLINANSFMKREFGVRLIERVLPKLDLTEIIDTSGAFIPGHGTPTVILFGRHRVPQTAEVRVVMGRRGEPETPEVPAKGKVWSSIADHDGEVGFENEFITVANVPRATLAKHPWSLGGGGASDLKEFIEETSKKKLGDGVTSIGFLAITGEDEIYVVPPEMPGRHRLVSKQFCVGEQIRDWGVGEGDTVLFPYTDAWKAAPHSPCVPWMWTWRTVLQRRLMFGKTQIEAKLPWHEYRHVGREKLSPALSIAFAFVATHNHFVLDHGGTVFKQSAPIIKLPATATEVDHLALLAWLNSSTACFWMKQVCFPKMSGTNVGDVRGQENRIAYEFSGTAIAALPIPEVDLRASQYTTELVALARAREAIAPSKILAATTAGTIAELRTELRDAASQDETAFQRMVALQEELDWLWYVQFGIADRALLASNELVASDDFRLRPDERPHVTAGKAPANDRLLPLWRARRTALTTSAMLGILEAPIYKRPWFGVQGVFHRDGWTYEERAQVAVRERLLSMIETEVSRMAAPCTAQELEHALHKQPSFEALSEFLSGQEGFNVATFVSEMLESDSVPFLAAQRHTETGLEKRALWERTWDLQRREDAGESVGEIPVPPKYDREDWRETRYWSLRGKLDVPRERFIAYPGAALDAKAPLYGWAGWNHLQRARSLAALYQQRKTADGWDRDRLRPLLAGLQELLPWLLQWHNEPDAELDGARQGDVWAEFLEGERATLGWSEEELRAWRPAAPVRGGAGAKRVVKGKKAKEGEGE